MRNLLIVVDMQNDFISGSLGSPAAKAIVENVRNKIKSFDGEVYFTKDTHYDNYLETQEGKNLPVKHCIKNTWGWEIENSLLEFVTNPVIEKETFGSNHLGIFLEQLEEEEHIDTITFVGLCTDICVISNAMIAKAFAKEAKLIVDASCCAGVTEKSHNTALDAMAACQISIINR